MQVQVSPFDIITTMQQIIFPELNKKTQVTRDTQTYNQTNPSVFHIQ